MIWGFLNKRRRKRTVEAPFPGAWREILDRNVPYQRDLPALYRDRLLRSVQILLAEKNFEGCQGLEMTDEIRVTIAGHAACLLLGHDFDYFPKLKSVLVYPSIFLAGGPELEPDGTYYEAEDEHAGQSWDLGVVILAWDEVLRGGRGVADAYNVVLHEFAHQLDAEVTGMDGWPDLDTAAMVDRWSDVMQRNYTRIQRDYRRGRRTTLDPYALENPAEFFAVATETFFEAPVMLQTRAPDLYALLRDFYQFDPVALLGGCDP